MSSSNKIIFDRLGLLAIVATFLIAVILSNALLRGIRIDLTENRLYTLSDGTVNILENISEPINLYLFFSNQATADYPALRIYAVRVQEMLEEFEQRSGGNLAVTVIDPLPFSEDEDRASQFGLRSVNPGLTGDPIYLGLAGTNAIGDEEIIEFFDPIKETLLEYELARLIYRLASPSLPIIGLVTALPMTGGFDPMTQQTRQPWTITSQIQQLFDLRSLGSNIEEIDQEIDLLLIVHPKDLPVTTRYAIDQYVLGGGRTLLFVDPYAEVDIPAPDPSNPVAAMTANRASNLPDLLRKWGVTVPGDEIVGDDRYALAVSGPGQRPVRHLVLLGIDSTGLDGDDVVTTDLDSINLGFTGHIVVEESEAIEVTPLILSSDTAGTLPASNVPFMSDPDMLRDLFTPTGQQYVLAARISGIAETAFPDGPPTLPDSGEAPQRQREQIRVSEYPINVILVADTDLLTDRFWVQVQSFFGQRIATAFASNGDFTINALDNLSGSSDLIGMRSRQSYSRPFTRVLALRRKAENEFRLTEQRLQQELRDTESKLAELQANREDSTALILSREQVAELDRFQQERLRIRKELRQVQRNLDQDIQDLGTRLKVINIGLIPLLIGLASLTLFVVRRRRTA